MSARFHAASGLIIVKAELLGPTGSAPLQLALDTGAEVTTVRPAVLASVGYDLAAATPSVRMTTASGGTAGARVPAVRLYALGRARPNFPVVAYALPPSFKFDGLLGLDFLRGFELTVDFRAGTVRLA